MTAQGPERHSDEMERDSTMHVDHSPHAGRRLVPCETDLAAGLLLLLFAALGWWFGQNLKVGTAYRMGPGYAPMLLVWTLGAFGALLCVLGVTRKGAALERWRIRPLLFVLGAMVVFAFSIEKMGLLFSASVAVLLAGAAAPAPRYRELAVLAGALALGACALFPLALQLPLKVLP